MTRIVLKSIIIGITMSAFTFGLLLGSSTLMMKAIADEGVPDWFRGVAGFWAEEKISTGEFLESIEFLITEEIITVPGFESVKDAEGAVAAGPSDKEGQQGPPGPKGDKGERGPAGPVETYVKEYSTLVTHGNHVSVDRNCESGDVALSGGVYIENKNLQIPSRPKGTDGWESITNYRVDGPREFVNIFVLCADITPEPPQTFKPIPMVP